MNTAVQKGSPALNRGTMKWRVICVSLTHQNRDASTATACLWILGGQRNVLLHRAVPSCELQSNRESKEPRRYHSEINM